MLNIKTEFNLIERVERVYNFVMKGFTILSPTKIAIV